MREVQLDGVQLQTPQELHQQIKKILNFPDYYGENLDALHDCLDELNEEIQITIINWNKADLGDYGDAFLQVLGEAADEDTGITVLVK